MKTKLPITHNSQLITPNSSKGFTLIELLVVIGVLGIMAAALVATIDPVEQIRKAQDSNVKNTAVEYLNAMVRYYATHLKYPWDVGITDCDKPTTATLVYEANAQESCLNALIAEKELKGGITSTKDTILNRIYVSVIAGSTTDLAVCFMPESRAQQSDPATKYNSDGTGGGTTCGGSHVSGKIDCYWCAK